MNAQTEIYNALDPPPTATQQHEIASVLEQYPDRVHQELKDLIKVLYKGDYSRLAEFNPDTLSALVRILELF